MPDLISVSKMSRYNLRTTDMQVPEFYFTHDPQTKSFKTLGDHIFMFAAPKLRNVLSLAIRSIIVTTLSSFKLKVKRVCFFI